MPVKTITPEWRGGRWQVKITKPDGSRPWVDVGDGTIGPHESEKAALVARRMAEMIRSGQAVPRERDETVTEWYGRWLAWRKSRGIGDGKKHEGQFRKYIEPEIGQLPMRAVARDHIKNLVAKLDDLVKADVISWKTAINVHSQMISKPFKDATNGKNAALCILSDNPAAGVAAPDKGARTKKTYLFPTEAYRLFLCPDVPQWRRRLYAFAIYTYMRAGEIAALRWDDVDLERGIITVHQAVNRSTRAGLRKPTKTEEERRVVVEPNLKPLLEALFEEATTALVFPKLPPYHGNDGQAPTLRADLVKSSGERTRKALIERARTRKRMTFHDLRATGITWAAIRGDDVLKIMARSGHTEYQTMMGYVREAEVMRDDFGEVFPELPQCLLGSAQGAPMRPRNTSKTPMKQRPQGDSKTRFVDLEGPRETAKDGIASLSAGDAHRLSASTQPERVDAVQLALAKAIEKAAAEGRWDIIAQLAGAAAPAVDNHAPALSALLFSS